jgi:hypothetical protein
VALNFSASKFALFVTSTVVGGLAQVWFLYVALLAIGKAHDLSALLGDGGLFFFTTSLTASSALIFFEHRPKIDNEWDLLLTFIACVASAGAIAYFIAIIVTHLGSAAPFRDHAVPQVAFAVTSFTYSLFVAARTGYFRR